MTLYIKEGRKLHKTALQSQFKTHMFVQTTHIDKAVEL